MPAGTSAARATNGALRAGAAAAARLADYDRVVNESFIMNDLHRTRNMRLAFKDGFYAGGIKAALMTLTGGRFPGGRIPMEPDAEGERQLTPASPPGLPPPYGQLTFAKQDAVLQPGNATTQHMPVH